MQTHSTIPDAIRYVFESEYLEFHFDIDIRHLWAKSTFYNRIN